MSELMDFNTDSVTSNDQLLDQVSFWKNLADAIFLARLTDEVGDCVSSKLKKKSKLLICFFFRLFIIIVVEIF